MKSNKSFLKRFKLTRNGKIVGRKSGQNHFNAKASSNSTRRKHQTVSILMTNKNRGRYMNNA